MYCIIQRLILISSSLLLQEIDKLSDDAVSLNEKFDDLEQHLDTHRLGSDIVETGDLLQEHEAKRGLLDNVAQPLIQKGEQLMRSIKANEPPVPPSLNFAGSVAAMPSQERQQVESIVKLLTHRYNQLLDMWEKRWKELMQCMDLRDFEAGYKKVSLHMLHVLMFFIPPASCFLHQILYNYSSKLFLWSNH